MAITDWPQHQRPRERLIQQGATSLSDAELLAIFLRVGVPGKSAVELGCELISHFGSLQGLFSASRQDFLRLHGLGPAKYAQLQAVLELARRSLHEEIRDNTMMNAPPAVKRYLQLLFHGKTHESFVVLFLDVKNRLINCEQLSRGTISQASVYPREVVKAALTHNASAVILAHNHPSGEADPSDADLRLTNRLQQALALVDITILDHLVVAGTQSYSFAEHGKL